MIEFVSNLAVFFVLFVFSGLAAVFFTRQYLNGSWMQLILGYLGAVAFATGVSTSLLGFTPVFAVMLALGVSAALIGFGAGVRWLGVLESGSGPVQEEDESRDDGEGALAGYSDEEAELVRRTVSFEEEKK